MKYINSILVYLCLAVVTTVSAKSEFPFKNENAKSATQDNCYQSVTDTIAGFWLPHSNRMAVGRPFDDAYNVPRDEEQTGNLPNRFSANFPPRSPGEYLHGAGLWVGGIKGVDTMVSHAFDFVNATPELIPASCPEGAFISGPGLADREHRALACDTIIVGDTLFRCQLGDCSDWYPMGLEITSHSFTWQSPPYDRTVIIEYTVKNIDTLLLEKGWVGIYADCDVGSGGVIHDDDISGYLGGTLDTAGQWIDLDVGYSLDMNGDAGRLGSDDFTADGILGVQVLNLTAADYRVNFNWWVSDPDNSVDWGPKRLESLYRDLGGDYAVPRGDSNKYFVMSNNEIDYNQIESGLMHPGWDSPNDHGSAAAMGGDTRFVISAGPFDLFPEETVTFTIAIIVGGHAVRNSYIYTWFDPSDPQSVSDYYEIFKLDELKTSALAARDIFINGYDFPPPGPPDKFELVSFDDYAATLVWSTVPVSDLFGYNLRAQTVDSNWIAASLTTAETDITLTDLDPDIEYTFTITSVDLGGSSGRPAPGIVLRPGAPHAPELLTGTAIRGVPDLHWPPSPDPETIEYRIYRIDLIAEDTTIIAETADTTYLDTNARLGQKYIYRVTAVADNGYESPFSPSLTLMTLMPTSGILAINQNDGTISSNPAFESAFFEQLLQQSLADIGYTYVNYDPSDPVTVFELSQYSLVILSSENMAGSLQPEMAAALNDYLAGGGKAILFLRHAAIDRMADPASDTVSFESGTLFHDRLMLDSSYIGSLQVLPGYQLAGDLIGADPVDNLYPAQSWDSARANNFGYTIPDGLPYAGYLWPQPTAEPIFTYRSSDPGSAAHGAVNGIRYRGDDYSFYLLNFPLSLMETDSAAVLLRNMVMELNETFICGDVTGDYRLNLADATAYVGHLFKGTTPPAMDLAGDLNCDGEDTMEDLLILINYYFFRGLAPDCCE